MIKIKIKGPNTLQDVVNYDEKQFSLPVQRIWIGRGEELCEKQNQMNPIINLADFSESISRLHACFIMSPAFSPHNTLTFPTYFRKFEQKWSLPDNLFFQIWQFARASKSILLKDMHSKMGLFEKIELANINAGMEIVFGDSRSLLFHHEQKYESTLLMNERIEELRQKGYIELKRDIKLHACSFWIISYKNQWFILRNQESKVHIGRSNGCQIVISEGVVSRKHATLQYINGNWVVIDGDGVTVSRNGLWRRVKKIMINCEVQDKLSYSSIAKAGGVMLTIEVKLEYSFLNVEELCRDANESSETNFMIQFQKELKQGQCQKGQEKRE